MRPSPQQDSEIACSGEPLAAQLLPDVHKAHAGSHHLQMGSVLQQSSNLQQLSYKP